jgi:hypothetical protein
VVAYALSLLLLLGSVQQALDSYARDLLTRRGVASDSTVAAVLAEIARRRAFTHLTRACGGSPEPSGYTHHIIDAAVPTGASHSR